MTHDGLYIPMLNHIHSLCMTVHYSQCHHYVQGIDAVRDCAEKSDFVPEASRRRYRRVTSRIPARVVDLGQDGLCTELLDNEAFAVDLSWGGIRLATRIELPVRKTVAFVLGQNEDNSRNLDGQGEVRWSRQTDSGFYHSGLLVTDKKTFEALGQHMNLS